MLDINSVKLPLLKYLCEDLACFILISNLSFVKTKVRLKVTLQVHPQLLIITVSLTVLFFVVHLSCFVKASHLIFSGAAHTLSTGIQAYRAHCGHIV